MSEQKSRKKKHNSPGLALSQLERYPIASRQHKVSIEDFARPLEKGCSPGDFLSGLPNILAAVGLKDAVAHLRAARNDSRRIVFAMGGHVVKTGLGPILVQLMEEGYLTDIAVNGAFAIHDFEVAMIGKTSEIVEDSLGDGSFGFALETGRDFNEALVQGESSGCGYAEAIARWITERDLPYASHSVLASAHRLGLGMTVHSGVGTEIIHQHPECDGATLGKLLLTDFRRVTETVACLSGGAWINLGSAVIMPEVLLKALSIVNNLGQGPRDFLTLNMDMILHYRPDQNVVKRPVVGRGRGYHLIGHHEILLPLLAWFLLAEDE